MFDEGRPLCDAVRGRLRYELRATWLGGTRILARLEAAEYDMIRRRPSLGPADAPWLAWHLLSWPRDRAAMRLATWRSELDAVYRGTPQTSQGIGLQPFVREFNLPRGRFEALIDGVEMDLSQARYETFDALLEYCRRVASAVGLICVEIFGYRDLGSLAYAESLGIALQLTNIIRDVAADLRRGRIYLPVEDLRRFGVSEDDLQRGRVTPHVAALLQFQCERAHAYYRRAAWQLPPGDAGSLVAAEIMGGIYYGILLRIESAGYDVFSSRIRVPRPQRALIALRIWLRALLGMQKAKGKMQTEPDSKR